MIIDPSRWFYQSNYWLIWICIKLIFIVLELEKLTFWNRNGVVEEETHHVPTDICTCPFSDVSFGPVLVRLKISYLNISQNVNLTSHKMHICRCMGSQFCVEFGTRTSLNMHFTDLLWSSKSFTLSQPANHLFIKINLLRNICTKFSHACCSLCR